MVGRPRFARCLLVFAYHHDPDVRLLHHLHRLGDAVRVELRIRWNHLVGVPVRLALGDAAAFGIHHFRAASNLVAYSLQYADRMRGNGAVAAEMRSEEHTSELQSHSFISYAVF